MIYSREKTMATSANISIDEQVQCAKRELGFRERCYPRWVTERRMTQEKADKEIACMQAIIVTLERQRDALRRLGELPL